MTDSCFSQPQDFAHKVSSWFMKQQRGHTDSCLALMCKEMQEGCVSWASSRPSCSPPLHEEYRASEHGYLEGSETETPARAPSLVMSGTAERLALT
ncbi:hypothetical protein NDU88_002540 [Pleurodeles waltl]|uniref:Uncharacterized protein n=1 Tax=Pleurodeles waltl TaxID=8319 RepID=A0AAV7P722_PLEWA|nr:hypothetical protein NDU88_002540 [Pleurodeles waltl]